MVVLTSSLTEPILAQVIECTSAYQIWNLLRDLFAARSSANVGHTRLQLASLKKGEESITDYYTKAKNLISMLHSARQTISDPEFIVHLVAGLGSDYESLVTSLTT